MKILIYDEDTESGIIGAFCEQLEAHGETALQVSDWTQLDHQVQEFRPDALVLDLMIPPVDLPADECGAGYTTGAYVYRTKLKPTLPSVPFIVFTAADIKTTRISKAIELLKAFPEYRGTFEKGEDIEVLLGALTGRGIRQRLPI